MKELNKRKVIENKWAGGERNIKDDVQRREISRNSFPPVDVPSI